MRRSSAGLTAFALFALGCANPSAPSAATISFRLDAATCRGVAILDLYIDGQFVATDSLTAGASVTFSVASGEHTIAFALVGVPIVYRASTTLRAGQTFTQLITCA